MKKISIIVLAVMMAVISFTAFIGYANSKEPAETKSESSYILPTVGTYEHLKELVEVSAQSYRRINNVVYGDAVMKNTESAPTAGINFSTASEQPDYSGTNIQVEGVDESDIVKTDGSYIYEVTNKCVAIIKAYPAVNMELESTIKFDDDNFYPGELYVDGNYLVVTGQTYKTEEWRIPYGSSSLPYYESTPYYCNIGIVKIMIYDISDRKNPKEIRNAQIEGNLMSSRKIGSKLYLVSNSYVDYYLLQQGIRDLTPSYYDSADSLEPCKVSLEDVKYFPDSVCDNFMTVGVIDVNNGEMKVDTYLGSGQNIYASIDNLYVAVTKFQPVKNPVPINDSKISIVAPINLSQDTVLYRFSLNDGAKCAAKGEVPGRILNQFSMDEYDGCFRIATTTGETWMNGEYASKNNMYVLDENLNISGKIEGIAPGEKIYSVRFMGNRGYMVTFRTVDPLFVIDFSSHDNPRILGSLKIPGFSDYLHPYDENHIIGFGKDTIEIPIKDEKGKSVDTRAYYLGMKIAIFDVTDVTNPVEMYTVKIGDRGTDSDLLYNHKALLFSKEKNLLAFPVNLYELQQNQTPLNSMNQFPEYGVFKYQGAYVYDISLEKGFILKGTITHMSEDEYKKSGSECYDENDKVSRILYIGDTLYTVSMGTVKASDMDTLQEIKTVNVLQDK